MKTITKVDVQTFLKTTEMRRFHYRRDKLCDKLITMIAPYAEKGISNVDDELDFCSEIEEAFDSGGVKSADERVSVTNMIYDALEFPHLWEG
jgi:hypothetical protein